ncbi:phosphoglycerate kinase [Sinanaerobacter chloroacetimidivorans]|uniref:Phosphoglycerate kinase n=1 Tax=Sinanaerobacter chloroacetimidivorans TaxID=2818044 RepID=A0A8J7W6Y1_9FIRM|nr:phosphoglycerate kinase [Sinanaerobacter chloroacetimidivorans]MBR0600270.1 phosphoglycerate kinase [Sinanaerobacter chloroacetimidivorans]
MRMKSIDNFNYDGKTVLLRVDINSPIDPITKKIVSENRIKKSIPTIQKILDKNAKLAIIAHQGDTLDYQNLIPLYEHAEKLTAYLGRDVKYIDDVCGPAAQQTVKDLKPGEAVLLGNLRYLTEEVSTFENAVKLAPKDMLSTYLVRSLAPLCDFYVNDAFAAAHRNAPSMVAFQEMLETAAGELMAREVSALDNVMENPEKPCVFVLGGAKISDAFGMMKQVLQNGTADKILTGGITGEIMLLAQGIRLGNTKEKYIKDRALDVFIKDAKEYLSDYPGKIEFPVDLAYVRNGERAEVSIHDLPLEEMFMDIGSETIEKYQKIIEDAKTIFVNGPAGVYEDRFFEKGTKSIWNAIADAKAYSVIGGGDTVSAAQKLTDIKKINYVCTAGGAMVQYLSGDKLPLIEAMEKAFDRW